MQKRASDVVPIASLTKLVTSMVVIDAGLPMNEPITILEEDKDMLRHSKSRLPVGTRLTREQALNLALMSSENRAAHALGRTFPGGLEPFLAAMNAKAHALGLRETRFGDPAGLSASNVSSAMDLARIVDAAHHYPLIRTLSTCKSATVEGERGPIEFHNTNMLIDNSHWQIGLSKTGFIDESGQCLVMQAQMAQRPVLIVLLDATGHRSRFEDANRIRQWMEGPDPAPVRVRVAHHAAAKVSHRAKLRGHARDKAVAAVHHRHHRRQA
jgi:D-alanyl-D-alanine endopeptidase (penicillin-binding protein 7)